MVLPGDPGQIVAVGGDARQRRGRIAGMCVWGLLGLLGLSGFGLKIVRIEREQFAHQHRQRPAVQQDVMAGEKKPVLPGGEPDQRKADERRRGQVEALGAILREEIGKALGPRGLVQQRQIDAAPVRLDVRHDDLHGPPEAGMPEARPQVGVAPDEPPRRRRQRVGVERAREAENQLDRIDVGRLRIVQRMEQQAFLQRRQRQDVVDPRVLALQRIDLALGQRDQRQIARRAAAGIRPLGVPCQRPERPEPALRQVAHHGFIDQRRRPRPGGAEARAVGPIEGQRIDLDRMRQGQRRIAPAQRHRLGRGRPVRHAVRRRGASREVSREATQIVEADLRHRQRRQCSGGLRVEVAQQPVAKPVVGQRPQLLLDGLERATQCRTTRQRIVEIERSWQRTWIKRALGSSALGSSRTG